MQSREIERGLLCKLVINYKPSLDAVARDDGSSLC